MYVRTSTIIIIIIIIIVLNTNNSSGLVGRIRNLESIRSAPSKGCGEGRNLVIGGDE